MKRCTIQIRDEVNIKLEGLDLDVRKALVTAFKYENPAARYMPAVRLGRWDGFLEGKLLAQFAVGRRVRGGRHDGASAVFSQTQAPLLQQQRRWRGS